MRPRGPAPNGGSQPPKGDSSDPRAQVLKSAGVRA